MSSGSPPAVTVLMPVYNAGDFLTTAVRSVLAQTYTDWELLLVDDGSTDGCLASIEPLRGPRVRVVPNSTNLGVVQTLNRGIGLARGHLIARLDADDVALPHRLAAQVAAFEANSRLGLLGSWGQLIDSKGKVISGVSKPVSHPEILHNILRRNMFVHSAVMMRTSIVRELGGYPADALHAEDYALWLRIAEARHEMGNLEDRLVQHRIHPTQISKVHIATQYRSAARLQRRAWRRFRELGLGDLVAPPPGYSLWQQWRAEPGTLGADFVWWSDLYRSMGDERMARSTARQGLMFAPLAKALWRAARRATAR